MPDHQEVNNPVNALLRWAARSTGELVGSIRRQAPGARMIGEFAVKHLAREAGKRLSGAQRPEPAAQDRAPEPHP